MDWLFCMANEVLRLSLDATLQPPHALFWLFFLQARPEGEEAGMVVKTLGSGISQNQALLCASCANLGKTLLSLEPQFLHLQNGNCNRVCPLGLGGG